jgi:nuclear transport factor 2 (NTF2) superfamily protein
MCLQKELQASLRKDNVMANRPPLPPFTLATAIEKVRLAEDGWNSRDPEKVSLAYSVDSRWRNRAEFAKGRQDIVA